MSRGIYVLANDRVLEPAIALFASLRAHDAETPVVLIPYDDAHAEVARVAERFRVSCWDDAATLAWIDAELARVFGAGFFRRPGNFRKQACWFGPFDEFLYLDADIVVFEPIVRLLDELKRADFVCCDDQHEGGLTHVFRPEIRRSGLGRGALRDVFNGGLFGARRGLVTRDSLVATWAECARHPEWFDFAHGGSDQPILNYLVLRHVRRRVNAYRRRGAPRMWAGTPGFRADGGLLVDPRVGRRLRFLHWAGRPIGPGGPYWETWRHWRTLDPTLPPPALPDVTTLASLPPATLAISAVVCTRNRAGWLERALASLAAQTLPRDAWEIVVVDNGSTDRTRDVVAEARRLGAPVRSLVERVPGLSRARNAGWRAARGRVVAFLDDDAVAPPEWLARIVAVFEAREPRPGCVGGPVELVWNGERPAWVSVRVAECFTAVDWSPVPVVLDAGRWLAGCNMAFARDDLERTGGFDERLGRSGDALLSMEEIALQRRLARAGLFPFYDPALAVRHHVLPERATPEWVERRVHWNGVSVALTERIEREPSRLGRLRRAAGAIAGLLASPRLLASVVPRSADPERFERRCVVLGRMGYVRGLLR